MEEFKVKLAETTFSGKTVAVVTAKNISINFDSMMNREESLSNGDFNISGKLDMKLANGKIVTTPMTPLNIKLSGLNTQITNTVDTAAKAKLEAQYDNWSTMMTSIRVAIATALQTDYTINNTEA